VNTDKGFRDFYLKICSKKTKYFTKAVILIIKKYP
jgi:hypothetical protein